MNIIEIIEELLPVVYPFQLDKVEKEESEQEVHFYFSIEKSYGSPDGFTIHQYYNRKWEHLNIFQYRCFIHCRVPIYKNIETGKTQALQVEFSRTNSRFTLLFENKIMELMKLYHCCKKVAQQLKIYPQRVEDVYHFYTCSAYDEHTVTACERIGVDETSTKKGHDYITAFVDMDTNQIVDIQDDRSSRAIEKFFHQHPNPQVIKDISADMSPAFGSGFKQFFPWARVTFDKWHVYNLLGKHLEKIHKRHKEKASCISLLFEHLQAFYALKDFSEAKAKLTFIADFAEDLFGENSFSKSIRRHFDGIVEYIRSKITNGILEGINSKIQTIKRVAKGFRYRENFKKMILFVFGIIKPRKFI